MIMATLQKHAPLQSAPPPPPPPPPSANPAPPQLQGSFSSLPIAPVPLASLIRPTTAGLLHHHQAPISSDRQYLDPKDCERSYSASPVQGALSSQEFKDELKRKQTQLQTSPIPVEERIQLQRNKMLPANQMHNLPDELLSAAQREKKPFAYTPNVSDPNNRGKLDLSHIKSPIMRRRLLANMESQEENIEGSEEEEDLENCTASPLAFSAPLQESAIRVQHFQPARFETTPGSTTLKRRVTFEKSPEPEIRYNEAPVFYNTKSEQRSQQTFIQSPSNQRYLESQNRFESLNDEVNKSLDSLSQLVSSLEFNTRNAAAAKQQVRLTPNEVRHKNSSFLPTNSIARTTLNRNNNESYLSRANQEKSIGDYLLSPDSSYFSAGSSNASPYSITPYYGSPLDDLSFDLTSQQTYTRPVANKTFTNYPSQSYCYSSNNFSIRDNTLEQTARHFEQKFNRLQSSIPPSRAYKEYQ